MQFSKNFNIVKVANAAGAGTTEVDTSILDMSGYDGVIFIVDLGTVTDASVMTLTVQQNDANSSSGMATITGASATKTASTSSNKIMFVDVYRPLKRYVWATFTRTTQNAVVDTIIAIQYKAKFMPITLDASILASATVVGS